MKEIKILKEKGKPDGVKERSDGLLAAMKIQKLWRGFATRRKTRRRKLEEMFLIGMIPRPNQKNVELHEEIERVIKCVCILLFVVFCYCKSFTLKQIQTRYEIQREYQENYENSLKLTKDLIGEKQGVNITENIADEIRIWFKDYQIRTGKFPDFPSEDNGGSRHLLSRQGLYFIN